MIMPIKFDTLEYARKLVAAGIPQAQATAQAQALAEALAEGTVTPGDVVLLKADILARLEIQKYDTDAVKHTLEILQRDLEILKRDVEAQQRTLETVQRSVESQQRTLETVQRDVEAHRQILETMRRHVSAVFWMVGVSMALHAVQIAVLLHLTGRLP